MSACSSRLPWSRRVREQVAREFSPGDAAAPIRIAQRAPAQPDKRQRPAYDKHDISRQPGPLEDIDPGRQQKIHTPSMPVARLYGGVQLEDAERKQVHEGHPGEPNI